MDRGLIVSSPTRDFRKQYLFHLSKLYAWQAELFRHADTQSSSSTIFELLKSPPCISRLIYFVLKESAGVGGLFTVIGASSGGSTLSGVDTLSLSDGLGERSFGSADSIEGGVGGSTTGIGVMGEGGPSGGTTTTPVVVVGRGRSPAK